MDRDFDGAVGIRLFGKFEIVLDDKTVNTGNNNPEKIFAYLTLNRSDPHTYESLSNLWTGVAGPGSELPRKAFRTFLRKYPYLERRIEEKSVSRIKEISLRLLEGDWIDQVKYDELPPVDEDPTSLLTAAELYRGNMMATWDDAWVQLHRLHYAKDFEDKMSRLPRLAKISLTDEQINRLTNQLLNLRPISYSIQINLMKLLSLIADYDRFEIAYNHVRKATRYLTSEESARIISQMDALRPKTLNARQDRSSPQPTSEVEHDVQSQHYLDANETDHGQTQSPTETLTLSERRAYHKARREAYLCACQKLELAQPGFRNDHFSKKSVQILVDTEERYQLPDIVKSMIYERHYQEWKAKDLKNNPQFGVSNIEVVPDDTDSQRCLKITAREYKYFEFLATNRSYSMGNDEEQSLLKTYVPDPEFDYGYPIQQFANALSVGLTMFCEDGECIVITQRSIKPASGSEWEAGKYFNAVGENTNIKDKVERINAHTIRVCPFKTARRGLEEEMGWKTQSDYDVAEPIQLHSFAFDREIFDYKFFGYVVTSLTRDEVFERWERAVDKKETHKVPDFYEVHDRQACLAVVERMKETVPGWSKEGVFSTLRAFELYKGIPYTELHEALMS